MKYVLFVCTHNAGCSQMAQAFFERHAPEGLRAESAGQEPRREGIWPNVVEAMREVGIDLAGAEVRLCADAVLTEFDDVPVRSHLMTIAHRKTRECLRRETCDVLAVA